MYMNILGETLFRGYMQNTIGIDSVKGEKKNNCSKLKQSSFSVLTILEKMKFR